jgi:UDP-N-acetylmuramyl pentapeptide phosphotransferase/UDP-N-acetylglucosamine-1-phosphate transferase
MYIWCISALAGIVTYNAINNVEMPLTGTDLSKKNKNIIPEGIGLLSCGTTIIACVLLGVPNNMLFPITAALLLGFMDDVIDIPWRMKLVLPAIASMPLEFETSRIDIGSMFIELGIFYPIFATFLCVYKWY